MEGDARLPDLPRLAEADRVEADVAQPVAHYRGRGLGREVGVMAPARVIGMAMGDQRARHGAPGVDMEIARGAIDAAISEGENW